MKKGPNISPAGLPLNVKPGDPISASVWNRMSGAVNALSTATRSLGRGEATVNPAYGIIAYAENQSETTNIEPFTIATISGQAFGEPLVQDSITLTLSPNVFSGNVWAVVLELIPPGEAGRVCLSGLAWVEIELSGGTSGTMASSGGTDKVFLSDNGEADVLASEGNYRLIRFPSVGINSETGAANWTFTRGES